MIHTNEYYKNKDYGDWWFIKCEGCGGKQSRHKTEKMPIEKVKCLYCGKTTEVEVG